MKIDIEKLKDMVKPFIEERRDKQGVNVEGLWFAHSILKDFIVYVEGNLKKDK